MVNFMVTAVNTINHYRNTTSPGRKCLPVVDIISITALRKPEDVEYGQVSSDVPTY